MEFQHPAAERYGVDVCLSKENPELAPECPHGPMLLFERFYKDGRLPQRFYACSASRDRKHCSFFQWEGDIVSEARKEAHQGMIQNLRRSHDEACLRYSSIFHESDNLQGKKCFHCHSCGLLFQHNEKKNHLSHDYEEAVDLSKPTLILRPRENEKTQAQYLFSSKTTEFLVCLLKELGFHNVLCVGTPRLHEEIQACRKSDDLPSGCLDSLLLDIDFRYAQFFPPSKFCWYNMFNHYFFGNNSRREVFKLFMRRQGVVLVMDPPFGGLTEVLSFSVKNIWDAWRQAHFHGESGVELPTVWIFPYFMEPHMKAALPSFNMLDYKVDYDNHPCFKSKSQKGSKRGSPVRLFTNMKPADVVLPSSEGYRFCKSCDRYVAPENIHCEKCNGCMSKDGRQYVHCEMCGTCVKPGRVHCMTCGRCETKGHQCKRSVDVGTCHVCGGFGHKRRDCLQRPNNPPRKRRKQNSDGIQISLNEEEKLSKKLPRRKSKTKKKRVNFQGGKEVNMN